MSATRASTYQAHYSSPWQSGPATWKREKNHFAYKHIGPTAFGDHPNVRQYGTQYRLQEKAMKTRQDKARRMIERRNRIRMSRASDDMRTKTKSGYARTQPAVRRAQTTKGRSSKQHVVRQTQPVTQAWGESMAPGGTQGWTRGLTTPAPSNTVTIAMEPQQQQFVQEWW